MKIMHVASFNGNIGDWANHSGFYNLFQNHIANDAVFDQIEIRNFYQSWDLSRFDEGFASLANTYDLVIIGGGEFFNPSYESSQTGTTIDISKEILSTITTPILFNGLGIAWKNQLNDAAVQKFLEFFEFLQSNPDKYFVSLRNDGSMDLIKQITGCKGFQHLWEVSDGGYFVNPKPCEHYEILPNKINIAFNLAGDRLQSRFPSEATRNGPQDFIDSIAFVCDSLLISNDKVRLIFTSHIPADIQMISAVMSKMSDRIVRNRVTVAPLLNGFLMGCDKIYDLYRNCDLTLGMSHHSFVCPIGLNKPSLGLVTAGMGSRDFMSQPELDERYVEVHKQDFTKILLDKIDFALSYPELHQTANRSVLAKLTSLNEVYFSNLKKWLCARDLLKDSQL